MSALGNVIPEVVNDFNVYKDGTKLIGVSSEVELPELEAITETISGAGILGELDTPATGQFGSTSMTVPFSNLHEDLFELIDPTSPVNLTLRGSQQCIDPSTGTTDYYPVKIVVRGKAINITMGNFKKGGKGEPEVELSLSYFKVDINGTTGVELDKLNSVFIVNGTDMLAKIKKQI